MSGPPFFYLRNCFWLMVPVLAFNLLFAHDLPRAFQSDVFSRDIPLAVSVPENVLRGLVFVFLLVMVCRTGAGTDATSRESSESGSRAIATIGKGACSRIMALGTSSSTRSLRSVTHQTSTAMTAGRRRGGRHRAASQPPSQSVKAYRASAPAACARFPRGGASAAARRGSRRWQRPRALGARRRPTPDPPAAATPRRSDGPRRCP